MNNLRFTGSDRIVFETEDINALAEEVADEILNHQYDGYTCRNELLAARIALRLCSMTESEMWYTHARVIDQDAGAPQYRVWVER